MAHVKLKMTKISMSKYVAWSVTLELHNSGSGPKMKVNNSRVIEANFLGNGKKVLLKLKKPTILLIGTER